jgi:predicted transcriptional regulator
MGNTLNIRIPDALRDELQELCERQHRPAGEVVRDSLRQYLAIDKCQALRRKTLPFAEAQGILTDEDVFEAIS